MNLTAQEIINRAERNSQALFRIVEEISFFNQAKVVNAFRNNRVSERHFNFSTGYGYDDGGRITLGRVFAEAFSAEEAIVSPNLASGTHTLTVALFGLLRPNDRILSITGNPYDTLLKVIKGDGIGSLRDYNVGYDMVDFKENKLDLAQIELKLREIQPKLVFITRSKGYSLREALSIDDIAMLTKIIRRISPNSIIFVDNCYGEFIEKREPLEVGADIIVGSLIKNPDGGLASTGGYIAGKKEYIEQIANRLTAPSLGTEIGSCKSGYLEYFQGFFLAPGVVESALKSSILIANAFSIMGYEVNPLKDSMPRDIIRAIRFNDSEAMIKFIQNIQKSSPVDSFVTPYPWDMPGYTDKVIMAAGTFIQGGSIELSADAPVRPPYIAYFQGGLNYNHGKIAVYEAVEGLIGD